MEHCEPWVRGPYKSVQVNVDRRGCNILGDAANEPSIAVDPTDLRKIVIGWRQFDTVESSFRQAGWAYSHDAAHTWIFRGSLTPGVFGSDPVLAPDPDGVFYYVSINFEEMRLFKSFDAGVSWNPPIQVLPGLGDKPWMSIDRTGGIGRGNIYISWTDENGFIRSTDAGETFVRGVQDVPFGGTLAVGPDGAVYVVGAYGRVSKSTNAQDPNQVPAFELDYTRVDLCPHAGPGGLVGMRGPAHPGRCLSRLLDDRRERRRGRGGRRWR